MNNTGAAYVFHVSSEGSWASSSAPTAAVTNSAGKSNDELGDAVVLSSDGTTALIGAPDVGGSLEDAGAAYVFHTTSSEGSWSSSSTPTATLTSPSGPTAGNLGYSVALSPDGTTALVGAPGVNNTGAAYVFHVSSEGSWSSGSSPTATLTNSAGKSGDQLGDAVALSADGTTALIGAPGVNNTGAAYVFHVSSEGSWSPSSTPTATLTNSAGKSGDGLGGAAALSHDGTTALIGAPGVNNSAGAGYVFHVSSEESWSSSSTPTATLTNGSGASGDGLGNAVALSSDGTTALIGADGVGDKTGAAYIFHASAEGSWASSSTPTATLTNSSGVSGDGLGSAVALSSDGTTALIGAPGVNSSAGAAYVFDASGEGSWSTSPTPTATLTNSAGKSGDQLGDAVALSDDGTTALIGAPGAQGLWAFNAYVGPVDWGAAYVFQAASEGSWSTTSTPTATLTNGSGAVFDGLGGAVALSSDGTIALIGDPSFGNDFPVGAAQIFSASSSPSLSVTVPSPGTVGSPIAASSVSAVLSRGASPTGSISFRVFGPQSSPPSACASGGSPVGTDVTVTGNGTYNPSAGFTPESTGDYWWYASYGGDSNNSPLSSACGAGMTETVVTTAKASPSLSVSAPSSGTVGSLIAASALSGVLSGGASPTGSISFTVFGPQPTAPSSCASGGSPVGTGVIVTGNGTYDPSAGFTPESTGDYWWYAGYGGDSGNNSAGSACGPSMAKTVVTSPPPTETVPVNTAAPRISGTAKAGSTLFCSKGTWTNSPTRYAYSWSRDGTPIAGADGATYQVQTADEELTITCTVSASNVAGAGAPALSNGADVPVPHVAHCPAATGQLAGTTLGLLHLGMTRAQARKAYKQSSTRGFAYKDFFCLTPNGVRVGYASPALLKTLPRPQRGRYAGRVIWASTSNAFYAVRGVRPGATVMAADKALKLEAPFHIGLNFWYLAGNGASMAVLKVRGEIVEEIGIGVNALMRGRTAQRAFLTSFS